jgi:hypothetical protein
MGKIKNIAKVMSFMIMFFLFFFKISYAIRPHGGDHVYIRTFLMQPANTIDVVYIGASTCLTNWIPMEAYGSHGFTSFNFGSSNMPPQLFKYNTIEVLKNQEPEVLIYDITPFGFSEILSQEASIRYVTDNIRYSVNRFLAIQNGVPAEHNKLYYHFDIAKYHSQVANLFKKDNWKYAFNIPDDNTKYFGGFRPVIRYGEIERINVSSIIEEQPFDDEMRLIYHNFVKYCADLEPNVIFIVAPIDETEEQRKNFNYARKIAYENGISFLSINDQFDEIGLDVKTDFYDKRHMNIFGAKKYTEWLGAYLMEMYELADRSENPGCADWDTVYELWLPKKAEIEQGVFDLMPENIQDAMRN